MPLGASASHIVGMQNGSVGTPPAYHENRHAVKFEACELCHSYSANTFRKFVRLKYLRIELT